MLPVAAADQYRAQQRITGVATSAVGRLWTRMTDDFDLSWSKIRPQVERVVEAGRNAAVQTALPYTSAVLAEIGEESDPVGELAPTLFLASAPDGRDVMTLYDTGVIRAKQAVAAGMAASDALKLAGRWVSGTTLTVLGDTRREVYAADIVSRPTVTGYVRMLNPPSCKRCAILAGKWFRWNDGFQRHPNCDCVHIPASEDRGGSMLTDPYEYFDSLSEADQDRIFGKNDAQAIRDGADIYRTVNIRDRGLGTAKAARKYGTPSRYTIDDILEMSGGDRAKAIRLMQAEGYILPRGQTRVQRSPGVRMDAEVLAAGRGRGVYSMGGQQFTTARAQRYDAAASGVRDPLARTTMTAAERRLYDAWYQLEYARMNGVVPRSIGLTHADVASGSLGIPATASEMARLEAALQRQIAKVVPGGQLHDLFVALGLNDDRADIVFERILKADVAAALRRSRR